MSFLYLQQFHFKIETISFCLEIRRILFRKLTIRQILVLIIWTLFCSYAVGFIGFKRAEDFDPQKIDKLITLLYWENVVDLKLAIIYR